MLEACKIVVKSIGQNLVCRSHWRFIGGYKSIKLKCNNSLLRNERVKRQNTPALLPEMYLDKPVKGLMVPAIFCTSRDDFEMSALPKRLTFATY